MLSSCILWYGVVNSCILWYGVVNSCILWYGVVNSCILWYGVVNTKSSIPSITRIVLLNGFCQIENVGCIRFIF